MVADRSARTDGFSRVAHHEIEGGFRMPERNREVLKTHLI
jgi:hypothetical protein